MVRFAFAIAVVLSPLIVLAEPPASVTMPPTTKPTTSPSHPLADLLPLIPANLGEADLKSFDVVGVAKVPTFPLRFRVAQKEPGVRMMYVDYEADGVPLMVAVNGDVVIYDAVAGVIRRIDGARPHLDLSATEDKVTFGAGIQISDKKPAGVLANVDFNSMLSYGIKSDAAFDRVGGLERVRSKGKQGTILQVFLDRGQPMPLVRMELLGPKDDPAMIFSRITVNQPVDAVFKLPDHADFEKAMTTKVYQKGILDKTALTAMFLRSLTYRLALGDPSMRPAVEKFTGKIDWDARLKQDAEIAAPLIKLLGQQLPTEPPAAK